MAHTVLFVDDDLGVLQALVRRLRKEPYQIRTATSAEEALGAFERCPIDLVVSDWRMPGISGTEFLVRVAAKYPDCIRIMLTGEPGVAEAIGAGNNGEVHRFLTKPCDANVLAEIIREALQARDATSLASKSTRVAAEAGTTVDREERETVTGAESHDTILAHLLDCVIAVDHAGRVLEFNPAAERTFRCSRSTVLGRSVADIFPTGGFAQILTGNTAQPPSASADKGALDGRVEATAVLSEGTEIPVELVTIAAHKKSGAVFTSFIRDMSRIRELEAALKATEAQLCQAEEFEVLRRTAKSTADEFDHLLTAINGSCELLLANASVTGVARETVRQIKRSCARGTVRPPQPLDPGAKENVAPTGTPPTPTTSRSIGARGTRPAKPSTQAMERR